MYMYHNERATFATKSKEAFGEILTGYRLSHTYTVEGNPCIYRYYYTTCMWIAKHTNFKAELYTSVK